VRKIRLPHDNKQHRVIEFHYIGVASGYQGEKCVKEDQDDPEESVATRMFATAEAAARAHPKARADMPIVLEVEVGNDHAREVYVERWHFELLGRREPASGRQYEVLARAPTEIEGDAPAAMSRE
jgi:hypothetical protein